MKKPYPLGTEVVIIDEGKYYPSNSDAAKAMKATKWLNYAEPENGTKGIITGIHPSLEGHGDMYSPDYLVDIGRCEIVIGRKGIKKVMDWDE